MAIVRSCHHESFIHGPAITLLNTGSTLLGHPSIGAWVTYGLGCESDNLPAYMALSDGGFRGGKVMYHSGYLPAVYQGTVLRDSGVPIQNLSRPKEITETQQRLMIEQVNAWNHRHRANRDGDSRLDARIANYELAYRMQTAAPELIELSGETEETLKLYGIGDAASDRFGKLCLMARRMVERDVRCVLLCSTDWDGHGECAKNHETNAKKTDQPIAGLLADLMKEWATMIAPHLKNQEDELFAAVAISNFLGWGNWEVTELTPGESLQLRARNSYESRGYRELRGPSIHAQCLMLTGAAAGLFGFVYGEGAIEDRFGLAESSETSCRCRGSSNCTFRVDAFLP